MLLVVEFEVIVDFFTRAVHDHEDVVDVEKSEKDVRDPEFAEKFRHEKGGEFDGGVETHRDSVLLECEAFKIDFWVLKDRVEEDFAEKGG